MVRETHLLAHWTMQQSEWWQGFRNLFALPMFVFLLNWIRVVLLISYVIISWQYICFIVCVVWRCYPTICSVSIDFTASLREWQLYLLIVFFQQGTVSGRSRFTFHVFTHQTPTTCYGPGCVGNQLWKTRLFVSFRRLGPYIRRWHWKRKIPERRKFSVHNWCSDSNCW